MRPEAAAGAREALGSFCRCSRDDPGRPPLPRGPESSVPALWRPWVPPPGDAELTRTESRVNHDCGVTQLCVNPEVLNDGSLGQCEPWGSQQTSGSKGAFGFQHPVRLYLPLSKRQEYLQSSGEKVLASFPVQATIHFYNDESESDSEEEQEEEAQPKCLQSQEAAGQDSGPGGRDRVGLAGLEEGRRDGVRGKGQLQAGGSECSSK